MTKPHHMRPPGRPMHFTRWDKTKTNGKTDAQLRALTNTEHLCARGTQEADIANLEKALAVKPLKPPRRRA